jgi:hypothetical protein
MLGCVCVCVCSGNLHFCHSVVQSIYKMGILWQAVFRRETHMVRGNTIWVWSMQIWPPKGLMLQTRLLSSHIALPFLYSKEGKESLRQFSPIHGTLVRTMFFYVLFCPNTNTKFCVGDAAESVYF